MSGPGAAPILVGGAWREADAIGTFHAVEPETGATLPAAYPVSGRADVDAALAAGAEAARRLEAVPGEEIARFLEGYAARIEERRDEVATLAARETALPRAPRLTDVELPRTTDQLRQAAAAARDGDWRLPTIDTASDIRSMYGPLGGPVVVLGPGNFPLAFNAVAGGDFAAALAAGNPVIAKAHPGHPGTSALLAALAAEALAATSLPSAAVQMLYAVAPQDGVYLVGEPRVGATAYTGSRAAGLVLKEAADRAGKPIYLEMSSVNPVFVLPGALRERGAEVADELSASALLGTGQFCTNPGLVLLVGDDAAEALIAEVRRRFDQAPVGALLGPAGVRGLAAAVEALRAAGADLVTGGAPAAPGCRFRNTVLRTTGAAFRAAPALQTEAFGNATLFVVAAGEEELVSLAEALEGSLTGAVYSHRGGEDDALYARVAGPLRRRVGRLLNDKMPTGVAVVAAMHHGGPYPATGHPAFTAVGFPAAIRRFAMRECYDAVRPHRLPPALRDANPTGRLWRRIDGSWTQGDVSRG